MIASVEPQHVSSIQAASIANAWAKAQVRDEALWKLLSASVLSQEPHFFDFRAVANILHAMAVLHIIDLPLLSFLERRLVSLPLNAASPQGTANVAWSVAVLHPILELNSNRRSLKENASDRSLRNRLEQLVQLLKSQLSNVTKCPILLPLAPCRLS